MSNEDGFRRESVTKPHPSKPEGHRDHPLGSGLETIFAEVSQHLSLQHKILMQEGIPEPAEEGVLATTPTWPSLHLTLKAALDELAARALDEPNAADSLYTLATRACELLWLVSERKPKWVQHTARKKMGFPCVWSVLPGFQNQLIEKVKALEVGKQGFYRVASGKKFDPTRTANRAVVELVEFIRHWKADYEMELKNRMHVAELSGGEAEAPASADPLLQTIVELPSFSVANAGQWADAVWQLVLRFTNGKPETHSELRGLGEHRKQHSVHIGQQKAATPRTSESNIRDGIRDRIVRAVHELARQPSRKGSSSRKRAP